MVVPIEISVRNYIREGDLDGAALISIDLATLFL